MMKSRTVLEVIASLLIVVFLYSATIQVVLHKSFESQVNRTLTNQPLSTIVAWVLPAVQLLLIYLLWKPTHRLAGLFGSLAVVSCCTVYLLMMLPVAYKSSCHCGELWQQATLEVNILINVFIILLIAAAIVIAGRSKSNSPGYS